jgi:hypothetical protein
MKEILLGIAYTTLTDALLRAGILLGACALLLYLLHFLFSRILYRRSGMRRELSLRLSFLWALVTLTGLFSVYLCLVFYWNGQEALLWRGGILLAGLSAHLAVAISLGTLFFLRRASLLTLIKTPSIQ